MINHLIPTPWSEKIVHILTLELTLSHAHNMPDVQVNELNYDLIPRTAVVTQANKKLAMVHDWLTFLECPGNISDQDYVALIHQALRFFLDEHILCVKTLQGPSLLDVSVVAVGTRVQCFKGVCGSEEGVAAQERQM